MTTDRPGSRRRLPCTRAGPPTQRQRGAALLAAMLTVTLVATLAAAALWQQWRGVEIEAAERDRVQAAWILTGALDWARLILREDARSGGADHLAEPWAVPLQDARLSTFLAADRTGAGSSDAEEALDAFLSGQIIDLQSRLNAMNLVENGQLSQSGFAAMAKLFTLLNLPREELQALAANLRLAALPGGDQAAGPAPWPPRRVAQLTWFGLSPATVTALLPYVTILPARTAVNLNTASAEVIYASIADLELADAERMVAARARSHFRSLADAAAQTGLSPGLLAEGQQAVASRFFEVHGSLRLAQRQVDERSLVQRDSLQVTTLWRERVARDPDLVSAMGQKP